MDQPHFNPIEQPAAAIDAEVVEQAALQANAAEHQAALQANIVEPTVPEPTAPRGSRRIWQAVAGAGAAGLSFMGVLPGAEAATGSQIDRIAGATRYGTAAAVAEYGVPQDSLDEVFLTTGENYPDALAAGAAAAKKNSVVLLTPSANLDGQAAQVADKLLKPGGQVTIVGGTSAVSQNVENQARAIGPVKRIAGSTRFGTAAAVAAYVGDSPEVVTANGMTYQDALVASSIAAEKGAPLLLTNGSQMPSETSAQIRAMDAQVTAIGSGAVTASPDAQTRITGANGEELSMNVAEALKDGSGRFVVVRADAFPDALAATRLAGDNARMLLVNYNMGEAMKQYLGREIPTEMTEGIIVGGTAAVSAATESTMRIANGEQVQEIPLNIQPDSLHAYNQCNVRGMPQRDHVDLTLYQPYTETIINGRSRLLAGWDLNRVLSQSTVNEVEAGKPRTPGLTPFLNNFMYDATSNRAADAFLEVTATSKQTGKQLNTVLIKVKLPGCAEPTREVSEPIQWSYFGQVPAGQDVHEYINSHR